MPTIGRLRRMEPVEPKKRASPNAKMPPSVATSQYPFPDGVGLMSTIARFRTMRAAEPWGVVAAAAAPQPNSSAPTNASTLVDTKALHRRRESTLLSGCGRVDCGNATVDSAAGRQKRSVRDHPGQSPRSTTSASDPPPTATDATMTEDLDQDVRAWLERHVNLETGVGVPASSRRATAPTHERIDALLAYLGSPQLEYPAVHLTGTNGKTSTARHGDGVARHGRPRGRFVHEPASGTRQRTHGDQGIPIADDELDDLLRTVAVVEDALELHPSYFEVLTAAAYSWFAGPRGRRRRRWRSDSAARGTRPTRSRPAWP